MIMFNPFLPSFLENPYPSYAALRAQDPVHRSMALQAWVVTSFAECDAVLRDAATFSSDLGTGTTPLARGLHAQRQASPLGHAPTVLNSDAPTHTRLRGIVNRAFTPRTVEAMRPRIAELAHELLEPVDASHPFDLMETLAQPLPVVVIAEMLGIPAQDRGRFKLWSDAIAGTTNIMAPVADIDLARTAATQLIDYLEPIVERRRREPGEDLLSALVQAEDEGQRLTRDELLAFAILLLVAGNETTTNLIGNGTLALLRNPAQLEVLRGDSSLVPRAVEEFLRFDSPVQALVRFASRTSRVGPAEVQAGETLLVMVGAANHDPAQFERPEALDVSLERGRHLAFGIGPHFCLGAPLARLEAEIAFGALIERFPSLHAAEEKPTRGGTFTLRGLRRLPVVA